MEATPEISIVMATYNRADTIVRTLDYLAQQDIDSSRFELIVVDDASPDNTADVVAELMPKMPYRITFLRNETNRGPGYTQNRGIREASAPILMIMTDDVFMSADAIRHHIEFHQRFPGMEHAALGKVLQSPELRDTALMRKWDPFRFWLLEGADELPFYMFWACNVSCKREFMVEYGMFKEHSGRGGPVAFEDLEVGYRLSQHGMNLHYLGKATGYHYHPYTIDQAIQRWYERGLNFDEFRKYVPAPELTVYFHVLNRHTFSDYYRVLKDGNHFEGKEANFAWHLVRALIQRLVLNRVTAGLIWRPLLNAAEKSNKIEGLLNRQIYRAFFYYHFLRGVNDAYRRYGVVG
jgi:glycosyltransferase involved in cell wall biosynthesis